MKQGSADDPFAEEPDDQEEGSNDQQSKESAVEKSDSHTELEDSTEAEDIDTTQHRSLPYIHARDGVKDGRIQRPIFLRDHVEDGIDDLVGQMEEEFDERVYKTDITEAAMVVAQENPSLLREILEEWGYGWS